MISTKIKAKLASGSAIRKMFEEGNRLKKLYGDDNVFVGHSGTTFCSGPEYRLVRHLV